MKTALRHILIFSLLLGPGTIAQACDICGCAAGANYLGILPQFQRNLVGLRYQYSSFRHPQTTLNMNGESQVKQDRMHSQELWLRLYPKPRIQLMFFVPYRINNRIETLRETQLSGIGDISAIASYTLVNTADSMDYKWKNTLLGGVGIRLPTGKYQQRDVTQVMLPASFQLGTGAYAYSLNVFHTVRYKGFGLNTNLQYFINGSNELDYDYGNQFTGSVSVFYWKKKGNWSLLPNIGVTYEYAEKDHQYRALKPYTGGDRISGHIGFDAYYNRFVMNAFVKLPVYQKVPYAQPETQVQTGAGVAYFFN